MTRHVEELLIHLIHTEAWHGLSPCNCIKDLLSCDPKLLLWLALVCKQMTSSKWTSYSKGNTFAHFHWNADSTTMSGGVTTIRKCEGLTFHLSDSHQELIRRPDNLAPTIWELNCCALRYMYCVDIVIATKSRTLIGLTLNPKWSIGRVVSVLKSC